MGMKAESTADLATLLAQAGWLRRFARALVGDAATADDLAQETMLSALRRPVPTGGRAWLATIARNLAVDRFRGNARRVRREASAPAHDPTAGSVTSPEGLIGDAQIHRHVAEAVARLAEPLRQTVVLRFYEGLSSADIARRVGEPEGTIRWRLKEALDRVRTDLDARHGNDRSVWRAALAPLLPAPRADAPPPLLPAPRPAQRSASGSLAPVVAVTTAAVALAIVAAVAMVRTPPGRITSAPDRRDPSHTLPSNEGAARLAGSVARGDRANIASPLPAVDRPTPPTPGRPDAQSLAEELLTAIQEHDYDAFVAKGSPWFRAAAGQAKLDAANAALGGRLSRGYNVAALGNVQRRRTVDWVLKIQFEDGGDDALCTLAMDGWQVAGFLVTDAIPQLTESHHE